MNQVAHRRHDIKDNLWNKLAPHLPGARGKPGRPASNNRLFINAVFWIFRTGAPWRDLPPDYGDWKNTHRRFCRWRDAGVWEKLLALLMEEPDYLKFKENSIVKAGDFSIPKFKKIAGLNSAFALF